MAAVSNESMLLEVINTKYKKKTGTLRLLTTKLTWIPSGSNTAKLDCSYSEVKVQRISPEGSSKVQLQVVLHDNSSYSIHFTNDTTPNAAKKERDEVKDLLAQLIPAHRKKASKELEEKNRILKKNPELYQLYKDLVVSGVITPEEFWENRGKVSAEQNSDGNNQSIGLSSALLADMQPESSGCNEVKYSLNTDTIESIFRTYPAVKKKHEEVVPDKMSEEEFWTKFFQSHYFHRDRAASAKTTSGDMFTECAKQDEKEQLEKKLSLVNDTLLDLTGVSPLPDELAVDGILQFCLRGLLGEQQRSTFFKLLNVLSNICDDVQDTRKLDKLAKEVNVVCALIEKDFPIAIQGYGLVPCDTPEQVTKNSSSVQSLFRRLNHHSLMVLHSIPSTSSSSDGISVGECNGDANNSAEPVSKKSRLREMIRYEDLEKHKDVPLPSLKLVNTNEYCEGPTTVPVANGKASYGRSGIDGPTAVQYCQFETENWLPNLPGVLTSQLACHVLTELSPGGSLMESALQTNLQYSTSSSLQSDLKQQYNALTELLRHFWSCFPVKSQFLEEKVSRMGQSLETYRDDKLAQFKNKLPDEDSHLADHLSQMLDAALVKYSAWQEKRIPTRITS